MKRVLFLSDVDINLPGGAQESMKVLIEEINDCEIFLITPNGRKINDNHLLIKEYTDFKLRGRNAVEIIAMSRKIAKLVNQIKPDIIHIQMTSTLILINIAVKLRLIKIKCDYMYTDRGVYGRYGRFTTYNIEYLIKYASKVITTTYKNKENYSEYSRNYSKNKHKFEVIYNTAGKDFEIYQDSHRESLRNSLEITEKEVVIGFCGRFSEHKDWPKSLEIIKRLRKNRNIKFLIIIGTDGTSNNMKEAQNWVNELEKVIEKKRLIVKFNIEHKDIQKLYYAMDIFVMTSKLESFGRTAVEAMARKVCVLANNIDGLSEVIGNSKYTFNSDIEAVEKLLLYVNDVNLLKEAQSYFYKRFYDNFRYKKNIDMYNSIYLSKE